MFGEVSGESTNGRLRQTGQRHNVRHPNFLVLQDAQQNLCVRVANPERQVDAIEQPVEPSPRSAQPKTHAVA